MILVKTVLICSWKQNLHISIFPCNSSKSWICPPSQFCLFFYSKIATIPAPVCAWWVIFAVSKMCVYTQLIQEREKKNPQLLECFLVVYKTIPSTSKKTLVELDRKRWRVWCGDFLYIWGIFQHKYLLHNFRTVHGLAVTIWMLT